jgi:uncharacterized protein (TIGR02172 family)
MNLELTRPLALGRTAEVYAWGDKHILKLYYAWCPSNWVEREARIARLIVEAGIPTPAAGEIIEIAGRRGIIYERVVGLSMLAEMNAQPLRLFQNARTLAELQVRMHLMQLEELSSYKDGLFHCIRRAQHLPDDLREKALARLETLPEGDNVCHADFHPGNVLLTSNGPVIIDWITATRGNPWADVARTSMILQIGPKAAGKMLSPVLRGAISLYHRTYLKRYLELRPDPQNLLPRWLPVIAAARLDENIEKEREALIRMVREGLG